MTLGELTKARERVPGETPVYFDLLQLVPTRFDSYRGFYDQLALGYADDGRKTAEALLEQCRKANGQIFEGWKGGQYTMRDNTDLWISNRGHASGHRIVGLRFDHEWCATIETEPE